MRKKTFSKQQIISFSFSLLTTSSFAMEAVHNPHLENLKNSRNAAPTNSVVIGPDSSESGSSASLSPTVKGTQSKEKLNIPLSKRQEVFIPHLPIGESSSNEEGLRRISSAAPPIKKSKHDTPSIADESSSTLFSILKRFKTAKRDQDVNNKDSSRDLEGEVTDRPLKQSAHLKDFQNLIEKHKRTPSMMESKLNRLSVKTARHASHAIRVLSLDGGGVRGLLQAYYLKYIEEMTGKPICELFHVICGTSVGGINAAALTAPKSREEPNKPRLTADDLIHFHRRDAQKIFKKRTGSFGSYNHPRYSGKTLKKSFEKELRYDDGTAIKWSEHIGNPITFAYNTHLRAIHQFSAQAARQNENLDFFTHDTIRAISAAPSYYNPATIYNKPSALPEKRTSYDFIDAGILLNNPAEQAKLMAEELYPENSDIMIVSIGTGNCLKPYYAKDLKNKGLLRSAPKIIDMALDNGAVVHDTMLKMAQVHDNIKYYRFQVNLGVEHSKLDDTSEKNLGYLEALATRDINDNADTLDELCTILSKPKYDPMRSKKSAARIVTENTMKEKTAEKNTGIDGAPTRDMKTIDKRSQLKSINSKSVQNLSKLVGNQDASRNVPNISTTLGNNADSSNHSENTDGV